MSGFSFLNGRSILAAPAGTITYEARIAEFALSRVLEFTGHSIHDVINDPFARHEVIGYYKLYRSILDRCEQLNAQSPPTDFGKIQL